jgi:predicted HTH transcriptional regulator
MTTELFEQLLNQRNENIILDFKKSFYKFTEGADKNIKDLEDGKFIKDIISFYNTKRESEAYIIIGVEHHKDGKKTLLGLDEYYDNAKLQDKIKDKVNPIPIFEYSIFEYKGKDYGIVTIPFALLHFSLCSYQRFSRCWS